MKRRDLPSFLRRRGRRSAMLPARSSRRLGRAVAAGTLSADGLSARHPRAGPAPSRTRLTFRAPIRRAPTDVGVPAFVNVIVSENYTDADRAAFFSAGLDGIETFLKSGRPGGAFHRPRR